ncbi:hypothetical protein GCM10008014_21100 [Paenibacillus silvae]|uniref:Uncharacterized protein n=1 Tax=Paenibacillus silvae TaxID=1325358 RepID=A0ABQ1Z825_9BACL|nr:hypothetical protein [Paenibacillus silvae]GGH53408.1 hypothetical protein GCM10008014_21100 [Paenibacillus silvae]
MKLTMDRIYLIGFYLLSILLMTRSGLHIVGYCLISGGTLALIAVATSLFHTNHSKMDLFINKLRVVGKIMLAAVLTALLIKGIIFLSS